MATNVHDINQRQIFLEDANKRQQNIQQHRKIVNWLSSVDYSTYQNELIGRRQNGTGEWLLQSNEFKDWISHTSRAFFCHGIPGAGKTMSTSIVVNHLQGNFHHDASVGIAYLYCNFRQQTQSATDLIANLLKQFTRPSVPLDLENIHRRHSINGMPPSFDEVLSILHSVFASYSKAFILIDALDECRVTDRVRSQLMSALFDLQSKSGANIFVTSRSIPDIKEEFKRKKAVSLEIRASNEDVRKYLDVHIKRLPSFVQECADLEEKVKAAATKAARGM